MSLNTATEQKFPTTAYFHVSVNSKSRKRPWFQMLEMRKRLENDLHVINKIECILCCQKGFFLIFLISGLKIRFTVKEPASQNQVPYYF